MLASSILGIIGFMFSVGAYYFFYKRWHRLSVIDLLVLSYSISVGAHSVVEAFIQRSFIVSMHLDPIVIIMVMFHALISTILIWTVLRSLHQKKQRVLRLRYMVQNWVQISELQQLFLLVTIFIPIAYGLIKFGIIGYLQIWTMDYEEIAMYAPYWYTSFQPFLPVLIYSVALSATAKISLRRGSAVTWIILLCAFLACLLYGRRQLFYLILLSGIVWYLPRDNLFRFRNLKFFIILICGIIVFSNIYQKYRSDVVSTSINILGSWNDISATMMNLQERKGPWYFNYLITESDIKPMYGTFFLNSIKSSIPRPFWPGKVIYGEDAMLADHYRLPPTDYPNNPLSSVMADFGILSVFFIPLLYLFVYIPAAYFLKKFMTYPLLYLILSVMLLHFVMNFEESFYAAIFGLYRYGTVIVILYFIAWGLMKFFKLGAKAELESGKD